jgi:uncharacterized protein (DUF488 family)
MSPKSVGRETRPVSGIERVLTIGAFGFNQKTFLKALAQAKVDLFVDVRARRAVRGAEYAFVNSARLQDSLAQAGIRYLHAEELAPSDEMRALQAAADEAAGIGSRKRVKLSPAYLKAYDRGRMKEFSPKAFAKDRLAGARRPVFFCVEAVPAACHRSIVAQRIGKDLGVPVEHLTALANGPAVS